MTQQTDSVAATQPREELEAEISLTPADLSNGQALIPGMGRRMLAYMLDYFLVLSASFGLYMLVLWSFTGTPLAASLASPYAAPYVYAAIVLAVNAALHIFLESNATLRATPGKFICGLQVIDVDGQRLDRGQAMMRFVWRLPSIVLCLLPYLIAGRGSYGLALHDRKAFTVVTTRMEAKRLQSGLLAGRRKTILDKACLVMAGLFLVYLIVSVTRSLLHVF